MVLASENKTNSECYWKYYAESFKICGFLNNRFRQANGSMDIWEKHTGLSQNHENHIVVEVDKDLLRLSCAPFMLKKGHLEQATPDQVWMVF